MPAPPRAPQSAAAPAPARRGTSAANTPVHHSVTRACATTPRARPGRPSSSPAARAAASGDRPVPRACTVDGTPLNPPASSAAPSSRPGLGRSGRTELDPKERLAVTVARVDDRTGASYSPAPLLTITVSPSAASGSSTAGRNIDSASARTGEGCSRCRVRGVRSAAGSVSRSRISSHDRRLPGPGTPRTPRHSNGADGSHLAKSVRARCRGQIQRNVDLIAHGCPRIRFAWI
jgi:hypothetical protein